MFWEAVLALFDCCVLALRRGFLGAASLFAMLLPRLEACNNGQLCAALEVGAEPAV